LPACSASGDFGKGGDVPKIDSLEVVLFHQGKKRFYLKRADVFIFEAVQQLRKHHQLTFINL